MVAYLEIHEIFDFSIGYVETHQYHEEKNDCINDCDSAYEKMCQAMSPKMRCLIDSIEYPFELQSNLDRDFYVQKEVDDTLSESITSSSVLPSNILASTLSDEVVQVEEMAESSTHSV